MSSRLIVSFVLLLSFIPCVLADSQRQLLNKAISKEQHDRDNARKHSSEIIMDTKNRNWLELGKRRRRNIIGNPCEQNGVCYKSDGNIDMPVCYCDEDCNKYNDCCFDHLKPSIKPKPLPKHIVCDSIQFGRRRMSHAFGSYLVSRCPSGFKNVNLATKCLDDIFPVSSEDGLTYKNVYCARCHNVTNYEAWTFKFIYNKGCSKKIIQSLNTNDIRSRIQFIIRQNCTYSFFSPEGSFIRYCVKYQTTVDDDAVNKTLCESFSSPLRIKPINDQASRLLRNIYCGNKTWESTDHTCIAPSNTGMKEWGMINLVGMFNVRPPIEGRHGKQCNLGNIYSPHYDACVDSNCTDGLCEVDYIQNDARTIETSFVTNDTADLSLVYRVLPLLLSLIEDKLVLKQSEGNVSCGQTRGMNSKCCVFNIITNVGIFGIKLLSENEKIVSNMEKLEWSYIETDINNSIAVNNSQSTIRNCTITEETTSTQHFNLHKLSRMTILHHSTIQNKTEKKFPTLFKAEARVLNNEIIELLKLDFSDHTGTEFDNKFRAPVFKWSPGTIFTYVTLSVSNVSLFFTVVLYKYLNLSRFRSGSISVHMMSTLLFAQLLFTLGDGANGIPTLCLIIGVISHYLWLSAFTWVSIFLTHVLGSMRKMYSTPGHNNKAKEKGNFFLLILGYLIPLIIVLPCVILDMFSIVDIGYADGICFPTAYPANLFSFTLPIVISLIINVFALSLSSFFISNFNDSINQSMPIRKLRSLIPVYIRMSALCACPWIIGILANIFDSDVLTYTFICLAGSQGTIVSICFLSSKTILSRIKQVFTVDNDTRQGVHNDTR